MVLARENFSVLAKIFAHTGISLFLADGRVSLLVVWVWVSVGGGGGGATEVFTADGGAGDDALGGLP